MHATLNNKESDVSFPVSKCRCGSRINADLKKKKKKNVYQPFTHSFVLFVNVSIHACLLHFVKPHNNAHHDMSMRKLVHEVSAHPRFCEYV